MQMFPNEFFFYKYNFLKEKDMRFVWFNLLLSNQNKSNHSSNSRTTKTIQLTNQNLKHIRVLALTAIKGMQISHWL